MTVFTGLDASFTHTENGMIKSDMIASADVANDLNEVIIFRSTGPWSRRWIEQRYPTKNFHVKGKSSNWGPQAGFVPYLGKYSKVGADPSKAADGTGANDDGLKHHFASKVQLTLTLQDLQTQRNQPEELPARHALERLEPIPDSKDYFMTARRPGDKKEFAFRAVWNGGSAYKIFVYGDNAGTNLKKLMFEKPTELLVMTSSEVGSGNKPMTGDYDLMCVCPTWDDYGGLSKTKISKAAVEFTGKSGQKGLSFEPGARLDKVLDMRSNTGAKPKDGDFKHTFQNLTKKDGGKLDEHPDMGNLTPRILRCINALNVKMGSSDAFRRVHHNAESHRNAIFAALVADEMVKGDGMPLTVFQPQWLVTRGTRVAKYGTICTLEKFMEFKIYAGELSDSGFFVPRNWTWGMSVRDAQR